MGYFANLAIEIEEALFDGATVPEIAERFNISEAQVLAYIQDLEEADRDPYPGD